ncbi:sulfatase-like hydrolase/transferase [uncultured Planktosalinus sp.]|uniref:sulfatase-like hydrolase/transferase n=1 Tax=uncultured Planktosalinus sp. TaxID=1810935 RepID=UPI0030DAAC25
MILFKKSIFKFLVYAFIPVILFSLIGVFYTSQLKYLIKEIVEFSLFSAIIYVIGLLILRGKSRYFWFFFFLIILFTISYLKTSFYYLYQSKVTISAFYVIFETTGTESANYLSTYFDLGLIAISLLFIVFLILSLKQLNTIYKTNNSFFYFPEFNLKNIPLFFVLILFVGSLIYFINLKLKHNNFIYLAHDAYVSYSEAQQLFQTELVKPINTNFSNVSSSNNQQTYVVIIGESTSARNMGLYGYYRNTNPLLSEIKDELLVFRDVISPHTHTIPSLNKVLSLSNHENPDVIHCGSVVQLANAAGFSTYWVSNQQPIGIHETLVTAISKATKEQFYTNALTNKQVEYDEMLLPFIDEVLNKKDQKKIIFIHLYGTHISYKFSYPPHFNKFTDQPKTKFPSARSFEQINHYDNAILYNDYIVRSIIDKVKAKNENAYVIYFSDHGDEVFQDMDFVGHNEYHATKPMYEIPFVVWTSEKFQSDYPHFETLENYLDRKYMLDDFIHSFSDFSQIEFGQLQPERSIFNKDFEYRNRMIRQALNYDDR